MDFDKIDALNDKEIQKVFEKKINAKKKQNHNIPICKIS